jgi:acetoacetyl-CoA synthetase
MTVDRMPEILWTPGEHARSSTRIGRFLTKVEEDRDLSLPDYESAWSWSVEDLEGFWASVWEHFEIQASVKPQKVLSSRSMPGARWFEGARLNYAEHALRIPARDSSSEHTPVIVAHSQSRPRVALSAPELRDQVSRVRAGLMSLGVGPGDRVAAYMPNIPETVVLMLATASIGAVFSSCAPEFGARAVIDRFGQIEPSVLVAVDGYRYGERLIDKSAELEAIRAELPSLNTTVVLPYIRADRDDRADRADQPETTRSDSSDSSITWNELVSETAPLEFEQVPFDHPLYVLYSSGTTGLPKPIVHSHGGILLEHCKALGLMSDIGEEDRFFWFTTTGWMMWNYLVSGLAVSSCLVLFDGDPSTPDLLTLWRLVEQERITWFGTSAPFLMACRKAGIRPGESLDLSSLKAVGSTGAPLPAEGAHWVYDAVARDVMLSSISGGTDVCTAFVGGCPLEEVRAGEIPCRWLGAAVEAYDEDGRSVVGSEGELVITAPMPSMPVALWGDDDGSRLRSTYFGTYPGVWRHGDWITLTERGSCVITGRSDATLNRGGVRMGTAELYSVVEDIAGVVDSLVVHVEDPDGGPGRLVLLVVPVAQDMQGAAGDDLSRRIKESLRSSLSPRHVPDEIHLVRSIPRTLSGKKLELPVKRILAGEDPREVASREALADPEALDAIVELVESRRSRGASPKDG